MDLSSLRGWQMLARGERFEVHVAREEYVMPTRSLVAVKWVRFHHSGLIDELKTAVLRQQRASYRVSRSIAPILFHHDAYYVTPHYGWSVLIVSEDGIYGGRWLFTLAASVLRTLTQLQEQAHMSHGNLKATNIFCSSHPSSDSGEIFLADFAPRDDVTPDDDLRAFGRILLVLIEGRKGRHPVQPALLRFWAYWKYFGWDALKWRAFCRLLGSPVYTDHPKSLEILSEQLARLDPNRPYARLRSVLLWLLVLIALFSSVLAMDGFIHWL